MPTFDEQHDDLPGHAMRNSDGGHRRSRSSSISPLTDLGSTPVLSSLASGSRAASPGQGEPHPEIDAAPDLDGSTVFGGSPRGRSLEVGEGWFDNPPFGRMDDQQNALYLQWQDLGYPQQPTIDNLNRALGRAHREFASLSPSPGPSPLGSPAAEHHLSPSVASDVASAAEASASPSASQHPEAPRSLTHVTDSQVESEGSPGRSGSAARSLSRLGSRDDSGGHTPERAEWIGYTAGTRGHPIEISSDDESDHSDNSSDSGSRSPSPGPAAAAGKRGRSESSDDGQQGPSTKRAKLEERSREIPAGLDL